VVSPSTRAPATGWVASAVATSYWYAEAPGACVQLSASSGVRTTLPATGAIEYGGAG